MPKHSLEIYTNALRNIIRSSHLYSKEHLGSIFEALIFSLQDTSNYLKITENHEYLNKIGIETFTLELINAILFFIESFNLGWSDSVKILELANIILGGCIAYQWPTVVSNFSLSLYSLFVKFVFEIFKKKTEKLRFSLWSLLCQPFIVQLSNFDFIGKLLIYC